MSSEFLLEERPYFSDNLPWRGERQHEKNAAQKCSGTILEHLLIQLTTAFYDVGKHGDPEREYNSFSLGGEYYAQGNGNYRDVIQNRRSDVLFLPKLGAENIRTFFELLQPDGFNPLVLTAQTYSIPEKSLRNILANIPEEYRDRAEKLFETPFTPGRLAMAAEDWGMSREEKYALVAASVCASVREPCADFSEGYWCDHWTYDLDLIESFLTVYPDCEDSLLFEGENYRWYAPSVHVLPRKQRYRMTPNGLRQYSFLSEVGETGSRWIQAGDSEARSVLAKKISCEINGNVLSRKLKKFKSKLKENGIDFIKLRTGERREILMIYFPDDDGSSRGGAVPS